MNAQKLEKCHNFCNVNIISSFSSSKLIVIDRNWSHEHYGRKDLAYDSESVLNVLNIYYIPDSGKYRFFGGNQSGNIKKHHKIRLLYYTANLDSTWDLNDDIGAKNNCKIIFSVFGDQNDDMVPK